MSVSFAIEFSAPIDHPERFATWSREVEKLLDYLPCYVAAGRKQRIFAAPLEEVRRRSVYTTETIYDWSEQHHLEPLILPDQISLYEQFIHQLPPLLQAGAELDPSLEWVQAHEYEQVLSKFYGRGPHGFMWLNIAEKGRYIFACIEEGGREPLPIRGPEGTGEPLVTEAEVAFNAAITTYNHGVAFSLSREDLLRKKEDPLSGFVVWNLVGDPHDVVAKGALIRLVAHFPEIEVTSDRSAVDWWEAALLCQKLFGVAHLPPGIWGNRAKPGEKARRQLISLANSLPDSSLNV